MSYKPKEVVFKDGQEAYDYLQKLINTNTEHFVKMQDALQEQIDCLRKVCKNFIKAGDLASEEIDELTKLVESNLDCHKYSEEYKEISKRLDKLEWNLGQT